MSDEKYIAVDFDGTLAKALDYHAEGEVGTPVWAMINRVKEWLREGKKVKIVSARASSPEEVAAIAMFLHKVGLPSLEITNVKESDAIAFYDDRAVAVEKNTGRLLSRALSIFTAESTLPEYEDQSASTAVFSGAKVVIVKGDEWSLPSGHADKHEEPDETAVRELEEETGITVARDDLIFAGYITRHGDSGVDSIFTVEVPDDTKIEAGDDANKAKWAEVWDLPELKFDHLDAILRSREVLACDPDQRGFLVVLEGIDGAGKTTQAKKLVDFLCEKGIPISVTKWNSSEGISDVILDMKKSRDLSPSLYFLLHAADMVTRYQNEIMPALRRNEVVICDRYIQTGFVRDAMRGIPVDYNRKLYEGFRQPDLIFFCKVLPDVAVARIGKDHLNFYNSGLDIGKYGKDPIQSALAYERDMDRMYDMLLADSAITLDMHSSPESIAGEIQKHVAELVQRFRIEPRKAKHIMLK